LRKSSWVFADEFLLYDCPLVPGGGSGRLRLDFRRPLAARTARFLAGTGAVRPDVVQSAAKRRRALRLPRLWKAVAGHSAFSVMSQQHPSIPSISSYMITKRKRRLSIYQDGSRRRIGRCEPPRTDIGLAATVGIRIMRQRLTKSCAPITGNAVDSEICRRISVE
jgi:hypothetical protein